MGYSQKEWRRESWDSDSDSGPEITYGDPTAPMEAVLALIHEAEVRAGAVQNAPAVEK